MSEPKTGTSTPTSLLDPPKTESTIPDLEAPDERTPAPPAIAPPPDGGLRAWLTILGAFCAGFVQFGMANAFGVFQGYYEETLLSTYSSSTISWIGAIQLFIMFFGGIFTGRAYDAYGPHALLVPGSTCFVLSLFMTSLCKEYYQFMLAQGILFGLGSALIFHPVVAIASQWFAKKRALATAIVVAGSGLGGTVWPIALQRMISEIGFPWTMRVCGFIALGVFIFAIALIRTRVPRRKPAPLAGSWKHFKEPAFGLLSLGAAVTTWGLFTPYFFVTVRASSVGASASFAFYTLSILNSGSIVGRFAAGVADLVGRFNLLFIANILVGILQLAFWIPLDSVPALIGFAVVYGVVSGIIISLLAATAAQISHPQEIGTRVGLMYGLISLFILSGPPINGAFLANYPGPDGYKWSGVFSGLACLVGAGLILAARLRLNSRLRAIV